MNNLSMALKNLKKNFSFYALYLLSVSFVITVFFAFTSFSMNTVMLEKISGNGRVETMCNVISVFLMTFVVFYMSYSNRFFLRRRTKELGVYALLGYRKTTVLSLLTIENLLVCFGAFIVGILLGSVFHKGIVFGITKLLDLSINNSEIPFFNVNAISKTACFIFAIVIVLMLSNSRFLFKTSLMGLVRFEKSAERKMEFHAVPAIIGFCCIIFGYRAFRFFCRFFLRICFGSTSRKRSLCFRYLLCSFFGCVTGTTYEENHQAGKNTRYQPVFHIHRSFRLNRTQSGKKHQRCD